MSEQNESSDAGWVLNELEDVGVTRNNEIICQR